MKNQNYGNHRKWVIMYHLISFIAILVLVIGSIRYLINASDDNFYLASLIVLISILLLFIFFFSRIFALKAQDRAIKAEESLRHFALTGKLLSPNLKMRQIVALRFASDEEFVALAEKAEKDGMSENDIKKAIKNWRGDYYRV